MCNHTEASFRAISADGQLLDAGDLPASILDVPEGNYNLVAWHHQNKVEQPLLVTAGTTNRMEVDFLYGAALLETEPPGATVLTKDGREWGMTPRLFPELTTGSWQFELRLFGYDPTKRAV